MSCLVTLHAHLCSYRYPPSERYIYSPSFTFMLQILCSSKSFTDLHTQFAFDSTQSGWVFLLQSLGADTHMFEGIFVVWVTPNICAFSRPLFLLAYIQMQMPYVTFYNVFKQRPMPSLRILIFSLLTFSCFQLVCCYSGVGKVLQCLKSPKS